MRQVNRVTTIFTQYQKKRKTYIFFDYWGNIKDEHLKVDRSKAILLIWLSVFACFDVSFCHSTVFTFRVSR